MYPYLVTLAGALFILFSILSAGHALLNKRDPKSALGWVMCCLLLPYIGPGIYLVFGINRAHTSARKMRPLPDDDGVIFPQLKLPENTRFPLAIVGYKVTHKELLPGNSLNILVNGDQAYPEMIKAINNAREKIYLATYIFANGRIADQFIDALKNAMDRSVDVKIILDGMGESMSLPPIGWTLARNDIPFKRFNPFSLLPPSLHLNLRNHRKLLVVDGNLAFTGGMNIADKNCRNASGGEQKIQDIHFSLTGHIVSDLEYAFLKDWNYCCGNKDAHHYEYPPKPPMETDSNTFWTRLVLDGPNEDLDKLSDILSGTLSAAKSRIWIMTPYFLPDAELIGMLQAASLRNLDVKIILPSDNNIPPVHWATRHLSWQLLNYGIEVYYQAGPFSHSKLLIIDQDYSLIGSANLDPRSLRLNFELSVEIFSDHTCQELEAYFLEKLQNARRFTRKDRSRRSLPIQIRDATAWLFSPYL